VRVYKQLVSIRDGFARELRSLNVMTGTRGLRTVRSLLMAQVDEIDRMLAEEANDDGRQL
jgi:hypothetical protein